MSFSTVIPFKSPHNFRVCTEALWRGDPRMQAVVGVQDGESEGVLAGLPEGDHPFTYPIQYVVGPQPFCFARNVNLGIRRTCNGEVVVLNDDAVLVAGTIEDLVHQSVTIQGIVSASVRGAVNNPAQQERSLRSGMVREIQEGYLAFVCVAIPRSVIHRIGLLDERFTEYGGEDVDYCHRARVEGIPLAVYDGTVVDHGNLLPSTFRKTSVPSIEPGLKILRDKWARIQNTPLPL